MERYLGAWERLANDPWVLGLLSFFGASLAGLTAELRSGRQLTRRSVVAALLHSGLWGVIIFLIGYTQMADNKALLVALSLLSGIGGATVTDFILQLVRSGFGIKVTFEGKEARPKKQ